MKNPLFYLFCLSLLWLSTACSDDEHVPTAGDGTLTLRIPASLSTRADEGEDASGGSSDTDATSELESGEGTVKDLWFMAYPTETGKGETLVRRLPTSSLPENSDYQEFSLTLKYGTYHVYVAANLPNISATTSEETLKNMVLSFQTETGSSATPQLPSTAQGLPMFKDCGEITISETGSKEITADLVFLCAKVKLTLEFDNSISGGTFGSNGLQLTGINIKHIAGESKLFNPESYNLTSFFDKTGCYTADERIQEDNEKKWNYTTTFYLPEYYLNETNTQPTYLEIKGTEIKLKADGTYDSDTPVEHAYTVNLGGKAYTGDNSQFKGGDLVRGTHYNLVAQISGTGKQSLDVQMNIASWTTETVRPFSQQTELWLSRTGEKPGSINNKAPNYDLGKKREEQILVTSEQDDYIEYRTNAADIQLECVSEMNGKPIIIATKGENNTIHFHMNPDISFDEFNNTEGHEPQGTAVVAVRANNLIKYVDVQYNAAAYLTVSPLEIEFKTLEIGSMPDQTVFFETNLGGIRLNSAGSDSKELTLYSPDGDSFVTVSCTDIQTSKGEVTLKVGGKPTTSSWEQSFMVYPYNQNKQYARLAKTVKIIIRPVLGNYVIHFTAINEKRTKTDGEDDTKNSEAGFSLESYYGNDNMPDDGWAAHNIYIYTQYGVTITDIPNSVWYFFDIKGLSVPYWPGVSMQPDGNNPGWMIYELDKDFRGISPMEELNAPDFVEKKPKPGETLIMFNSGDKYEGGSSGERKDYLGQLHRYPYHLEPGISLFDFSNREGWFVYDPTVGSYEFYSEKPEIKLVTYTMYTEKDAPVINNWWRSYGVSTNRLSIFGYDKGDILKVYDDDADYTATGAPENVDGWNVTTLKLWAVTGREAKNITVKHYEDNASETNYGILFGGQRFTDNTGYYSDGTWHSGTPAPVTTP